MAFLRLEDVLDKLKRRIMWSKLGVKWVVVFGSLASREAGRDVDLLVMPQRRCDASLLFEVVGAVAEALDIDWSRVDVVEASVDTPCPIVVEAWLHGIVVYEQEEGAAREWLLTRMLVCGDYELAARRLGAPWKALEAIWRRWGSGGTS